MARMRKGEIAAVAVLKSVIIGGVAFIILAVTFKMLFLAAEDEFTDKECQASLLKSKAVDDALSVSCVVPTPNLPLKCNRNFIDVKEEEILFRGEDISYKYDYTCPEGFTTEECVEHNVLAEEMAACWQLFFQGETAVFQQVQKNSLKIWERKDSMRSCFVCSEVTLHDKPVANFTEYIKKTNYNDEDTYYSYVAQNPDAICDPSILYAGGSKTYDTCWEGVAAGNEPDFFDRGWPKLDTDNFPAGNTFSVTFMRRGLGSCETMKTWEKVTSGFVIQKLKESIFGPFKFLVDSDTPGEELDFYLTNSVQVIPSSQIGRYCDVVMV